MPNDTVSHTRHMNWRHVMDSWARGVLAFYNTCVNSIRYVSIWHNFTELIREPPSPLGMNEKSAGRNGVNGVNGVCDFKHRSYDTIDFPVRVIVVFGFHENGSYPISISRNDSAFPRRCAAGMYVHMYKRRPRVTPTPTNVFYVLNRCVRARRIDSRIAANVRTCSSAVSWSRPVDCALRTRYSVWFISQLLSLQRHVIMVLQDYKNRNALQSQHISCVYYLYIRVK
jgi:hypothetical protein